MPNHVSNVLKLKGEPKYITEMLERIKSDDSSSCIDFNKIIPMPESLNIESGTSTDRGIKLYLLAINPSVSYYSYPLIDKFSKEKYDNLMADIQRKFRIRLHEQYAISEDELSKLLQLTDEKSDIELGKKAVENIANYGCATWYEWGWKNWGTKWNAYECWKSYDGTEIGFTTAWCGVYNLIQKLSEMFSHVLIQYSWANEDIGYGVGSATFRGGEEFYSNIPEEGSREAMEMACELWGYDVSEFEDGYECEEE